MTPIAAGIQGMGKIDDGADCIVKRFVDKDGRVACAVGSSWDGD